MNDDECRVRPTTPNPFGGIDPPMVGNIDAVLARARQDRAAGVTNIVEKRVRGVGWVAYRIPVTVEDLRKYQLAREVARSFFNEKTMKMQTSTAWQIDPAGYAVIRAAEHTDPAEFSIADEAQEAKAAA